MKDAAEINDPRANNVLTLRLLLALGVIYFHAQTTKANPWFFTYPFVPTFMTLSGAVVMGSLERTRSVGEFIKRRILRIYPALVLALLLGLALGSWAPDQWPKVMQWYVTGGIKGWGTALWPSWSLMWEQLCYGLLIVLFGLGVYRRPAVVGWMIFGLLYIWMSAWARALPLYAWSSFHLVSCFLMGNLIHIYKGAPGMRWFALPLIFLGFVPAFSLIAAPLGCTIWALTPHPFGKWIDTKIGDVSYGLYIYHWPILVWVKAFDFSAPVRVVATMLIAFGVSYLSWHLVEKPISKLKHVPRRELAPEPDRVVQQEAVPVSSA